MSRPSLSGAEDQRDLFLERAVHDLRAAARGISIASELGIGTLSESMARMNGILDGMSRYLSAVRHAEYALESCSTDHALTAATQTLGPMIRESEATIVRTHLPLVHGDPRWIRELFSILILNSISYRSPAPPEISFNASAEGEFWLFSVKDNGIGVEAKYGEKIFAPFERLHGQSLPGAGLGLSIAQTIVQGHGGKIWLGEAPRGATIHFHLPQPRPELQHAPA